MEQKTDLAIVLPLYNPHKDWEKQLSESINIIKELFIDITIVILIVNDGSTTNISQEINVLKQNFGCVRYIHNHQNKGKGDAIRTGLKNVSATHYIYTDLDFPFGEKILYDFYKKLKDGNYDIILSNRDNKYYNILPKERKIISKLLKLTSYFLLGFNAYDTQAGLKAINENAKRLLIDTQLNSFLFELEFIKKAIKNKLHLTTIEVMPKSNIKFTNFGFKTVINEIKSLLKIIFNVKKK
ncbi:glycosyltransferase family 2 protein [Eisenibacter elegans]|uniref:glycosyltransferase family 2 protein n=1 Tax=Eisenibacter elegans TaxID=997 RepID=UPI00040CB1EA|nr:glycosyltransferase family 2 protein [Eisenibacter elegans]